MKVFGVEPCAKNKTMPLLLVFRTPQPLFCFGVFFILKRVVGKRPVKFIFTTCARQDATSVLKFSQPKKVHLRRKLGFSGLVLCVKRVEGKRQKLRWDTMRSSESKKLMASERKVSN
jgi:hypothetical protein